MEWQNLKIYSVLRQVTQGSGTRSLPSFQRSQPVEFVLDHRAVLMHRFLPSAFGRKRIIGCAERITERHRLNIYALGLFILWDDIAQFLSHGCKFYYIAVLYNFVQKECTRNSRSRFRRRRVRALGYKGQKYSRWFCAMSQQGHQLCHGGGSHKMIHMTEDCCVSPEHYTIKR